MKDKKERKIKIRRFWKIKPATKIKQSETVYSRAKEKKKIEEEAEEEQPPQRHEDTEKTD